MSSPFDKAQRGLMAALGFLLSGRLSHSLQPTTHSRTPIALKTLWKTISSPRPMTSHAIRERRWQVFPLPPAQPADPVTPRHAVSAKRLARSSVSPLAPPVGFPARCRAPSLAQRSARRWAQPRARRLCRSASWPAPYWEGSPAPSQGVLLAQHSERPSTTRSCTTASVSGVAAPFTTLAVEARLLPPLFPSLFPLSLSPPLYPPTLSTKEIPDGTSHRTNGLRRPNTVA